MSENPVYLRIKQIAKLLNVSKNTWQNWVKSGKAPSGIRLGERVIVWEEKAIQDFINSKVEAKP